MHFKLGSVPIALFLCAISAAAAWPSSWGNRPHHRRAIPDDPDTPNKIEDEDAVSGMPYAPGSHYKLPLGMWSGAEQAPEEIPEETEDNMAVPNFNHYKHSKKNTMMDTTFSTGETRMNPHHLRPSKVKRAPKVDLARPRIPPKFNSELKVKVEQPTTEKTEETTTTKEQLQTTTQTPFKNETVEKTSSSTENRTESGRVRVMKKREGRMSREEQRQLMGELGNILKDDEKAKRIPPDVKRQTNEKYDDDLLPLKSTTSGSSKSSLPMSPSDRQAFDEWLREEYFRNMALSMSTAKRKRSSPSDSTLRDMRKKRKVDFDTNGMDDEPLEEEEQDEGEDSEEVFDPEAIQERLEVLENAVLNEAVESIVEKARDTAMAEAARDEVTKKLEEAFYIERLQKALEERFMPATIGQHHWKQLSNKVKSRKPNDWGKFEEGKSDWINGENKRSGNGNLAEALNGMPPSNNKRKPDALPCPELRLLTSDCEGLEDVIPPDTTISYQLQHVCNKHEVCYTCGEVFGLTSSSCDNKFLKEAAELCLDEEGCDPRDLKRLLTPLRERRVFFKRSIPPLCYRAHVCIGHFLTEP